MASPPTAPRRGALPLILLLLGGCDGCVPKPPPQPSARCVEAPSEALEAARRAVAQVAAEDGEGLWETVYEPVRLRLNPGDFATTVKGLSAQVGPAPKLRRSWAAEIRDGRVDEPLECAGALLQLGLANQTVAYIDFDVGGAPLAKGLGITVHGTRDGWRVGAVELYERAFHGRGTAEYEAQADAHNQAEDVLSELCASLAAWHLAGRGVGVQTPDRRRLAARVKEVRAELPPELWVDSVRYELQGVGLHVGDAGIAPELHYRTHGTLDERFLRDEVGRLLKMLRVRHARLAEDFQEIRFSAHARPDEPSIALTRPLRGD